MKKVFIHIRHISEMFASFFKVRSIRFIITVSFAFTTILAMLILGVTLYGKFTRTAEQNVALNTRQIVDQVNLNLDYYQRNMMEVASMLESSINKTPDLPNAKLEEQMDVIMDIREDIVSIAVFTKKGELVIGSPFSSLKEGIRVQEQEWFKLVEESSQQGIFFSSPHVQNLFPFKHNWVISVSRPISFFYKGDKQEGVILVDMNFSYIDQISKKASLGRRGYIYITDSKGNILYHPQQQLIYSDLKQEDNEAVLKHSYGSFIQKIQGEERLVTVKTVNYTGWKIAGISYIDELVTTKRDIINFSGWILLFAVAFVISIFMFISAKITQPIKELDQSMKRVEEGEFDINVDIKGDREVVHLSKTFNMMVSRIKLLMNQIVYEQEAKRKSELNALQAQINPHFLYNTLDSIVWMAENRKSSDVIVMITALARLFRISISRGKNIITIKEELEHAKNYLIIQKIRYKNKFQYTIEADEEVFEYKTIKLILQPIIENAIYHGIEYMVDEGEIKISARIIDQKLMYEIRDNGLGMNKETMEKLLSYESKDKGGSGVGVKNVHERIQLSFGKEYGVEIESELEEGTAVRLWLPLIKEEELN
jgi:two-component system, sensor histidine kinase YesM